MKTSNKILILALSIFVLSYLGNILFMIYSVKAEITKPYTLNGNIITFDKNIEENDGISLEGNLNVILKKDTINKAEIIADKNLIQLLEFYNKGNTFTISTNNATYRNSNKDRIKIILHLKSFANISCIDKVSITCDSIINEDDFNLSLLEYSSADIKLNTKSFNCNLVSNSTCKIAGKTDEASINIMRNSALSAKEFCIEDCSINEMKNSTADLNVKGSISKVVSNNSKINIVGKPKEKK